MMGDLPTEFIDMYIERTEGLSNCVADDNRTLIPSIRHSQGLKYQDMLQIEYTMDMFEPNSPASIYDESSSPVHHLHSLQPCSYGSPTSVGGEQWSFATPQYEPHDGRSLGPMMMQGPGDIKVENQYHSSEYGTHGSCHRESSLSPPTHDSYMNSTDYGYESDASVELTMDGSSSGSSPCFQQTVFGLRPTPKMKYNNPSCPLPQFSEIFAQNMRPQMQKNNRRGRPVTFIKLGHYYSDSDNFVSDEDDRVAPRCRRGAKNILLWKFLLQELRNPNVTHVKWENEHEGTFKFVDTNECSKLWGQMKKKEDMNFEKLSRGIRHYYRDGLMSRKDGIRLVYKFNWDRVPKPFRPQY